MYKRISTNNVIRLMEGNEEYQNKDRGRFYNVLRIMLYNKVDLCAKANVKGFQMNPLRVW